jgi:hypothetical protein
MSNTISQLTPYTCALACLESFLLDLGHRVTQAEMLAHHRDICLNQSDIGTYGAIDEGRLKVLARRYLCVADDFATQDEKQIVDQLTRPREALVACCHRFSAQDNSNHCVRLIRVDQSMLHFSSPGFPYGKVESVSLADFFAQWQPAVLKLRPLA